MKNQLHSTNDGTINSLIAKFLGGNPSAEEMLELEEWINQSEKNKEYFGQMKNIWQLSGHFSVSTDPALATVLSKIKTVSVLKTLVNTWQKIAAILVIPLFLTTLWLLIAKEHHTILSSNQYQTVTAAFGTFSTLQLPDGTKVWLNSGSTIKYPEKFTDANRNVFLTGEAYFEVKSDSTCPFLVNTSSFTVKATGTRFNVMAYADDYSPSVALAEGKVSIMTVGRNHKNGTTTKLKPEQYFTYNLNNELTTVRNEDAYKHYAWKDGRLVFRNDLLTEVANRISRQYNVDIEITSEDVKQYRFRATFENESLTEVLYLLKLSSHFEYKAEGQKKSPDGSYTRKKIIIYSTNK
jgi:transmembrane sensor